MTVHNIFEPYHSNYYRNRRVDISQKINSTDTLFGFLNEVKATESLLPDQVGLRDCRIRTLKEATWVLNTINTPQSRYSSLRSIQSDGGCWQTWDFVPSNLRRGFLFYFVCDRCKGRVKYLYNPDGQFRYLCRTCHGVSYPTKQQREIMKKRIEANQIK